MPLFEVRASRLHGAGAFALQPIPAKTKIVEYVGERLNDRQVEERYGTERLDNPHTFLFWVRDDLYVDAAVGGNDARFINHSCDPNCEAVIEDGRIFIEAIRTIHSGEELAYDYQYERTGSIDESDASRYVCRCGAVNCRGTILAPEKRGKRRAARA
jgi:SET domain-containing protein